MSDTVEQILTQLFSAWPASNADVLRQRRDGFDWLPGHHVVHVHCHERPDERGEARFRLAVTTDYLKSVPVSDHFVRQASLMADFLWPTCAPVYRTVAADGTAPDMHLCSSIYFNGREAEALTALFAGLALLQPVYAERQSSTAPDMLGGGAPARTPREGEINNPAILQVNCTVYPKGAERSAWIGSREFKDFARERRSKDFTISAGQSGMVVDVHSSAAQARIVFGTDQPHPHCGNGLLVWIELGTSRNLDEVCRQAGRLNLLEASNWTEVPQLGCWSASEISQGQFQLGHCTFIPNASFMPHLVAVLADWAVARVWWAQSVLQPEQSEVQIGRTVGGWLKKLWRR